MSKRNSGLGLRLIEHGAKFAVGMEMVKLGKNVKANKKAVEEEMSNREDTPVKSPPQEYEYVFYREYVEQTNRVVSGLVEKMIRNNIEVEEVLYNETREILDLTNYLLNATKKEEDGNQADS